MLLGSLLSGVQPLTAHAANSTVWGMDELRSALPEEAAEYLAGETPESLSGETVRHTGGIFADKLRRQWHEELRFCLLLLSVVLITSVTSSAGANGKGSKSVTLAAVASVSAAAVSDVNSYMELARTALQQLSDYADVLLPTLAAAGSITGGIGAAAGKCAATALFMNVLIRLAGAVIFPLICGYAGLSMASAAVGNHALDTAGRLLRSGCTLLLTALAVGFTCWISAVSIVVGSGSEAASRLTKTALSSALPVVGKILSDASGALSSAAVSIRSTGGIFGLLAVLCICFTPCLRLGLRLLVYKLTAAVCQCLCGDTLSGLLGALGDCFAMELLVIGTAALALFVTVYSLMKAVI